MTNNIKSFAVGDIIENEELNLEGEVLAVDDENITIGWNNNNEVVEETVSLAEMSAKTLNSYVKKAKHGTAYKNPATDVFDQYKRSERERKSENRHRGVKVAMKKLGSNFKPTLYDRLVGKNPGQEEVELGDIIENEETNLKGKVVAIEDGNVTIHWEDGENIVEEVISMDELACPPPSKKTPSKLKGKAAKAFGLGKVHEDTAALASLKPHSHDVADPKSKLEVMKSVLGELGKMEDNDAVAFFHKVMGQFDNHLADPVSDNSAKNRATLNMHPSDAVGKGIKEDVEKLFEGAEVTADFKEKTTTLFEAALSARMAIFEAEVEEQAAQLLNERVEELEEEFGEALEEIDEQVETYMDYVATKWLEENEIAIESSLRNDLTQDFIDGIKELFYEHYIDIPEDRVDVVDELASQIEEMQVQLNDAIDETVRLREIILEATAEEAFEEVADGLAITEQDKLRTLVESVDFEGDVDKFKEKLTLIKESHFSKNKKEPKVTLNDEFHGNEKTLTEVVDPRVERYVQNLSRSHLNK